MTKVLKTTHEETKMDQNGVDGLNVQHHMQKPNAPFQQKDLVPTVKRAGGGVMIWGCLQSDDLDLSV